MCPAFLSISKNKCLRFKWIFSTIVQQTFYCREDKMSA